LVRGVVFNLAEFAIWASLVDLSFYWRKLASRNFICWGCNEILLSEVWFLTWRGWSVIHFVGKMNTTFC